MVPFVCEQIDRQQAVAKLAKRRFLRSSVFPDRVEMIYVPHYLFRVTLTTRSSEGEYLAIDAIHGLFSYYNSQDTQDSPNREATVFAFQLDRETAQARGLSAYSRAVYQVSLKSGGRLEIKDVVFEKRMYFPYWVGYFSAKGRISFSTIDAVSGAEQGSKFKPIILQGLTQLEKEPREQSRLNR